MCPVELVVHLQSTMSFWSFLFSTEDSKSRAAALSPPCCPVVEQGSALTLNCLLPPAHSHQVDKSEQCHPNNHLRATCQAYRLTFCL